MSWMGWDAPPPIVPNSGGSCSCGRIPNADIRSSTNSGRTCLIIAAKLKRHLVLTREKRDEGGGGGRGRGITFPVCHPTRRAPPPMKYSVTWLVPPSSYPFVPHPRGWRILTPHSDAVPRYPTAMEVVRKQLKEGEGEGRGEGGRGGRSNKRNTPDTRTRDLKTEGIYPILNSDRYLCWAIPLASSRSPLALLPIIFIERYFEGRARCRKKKTRERQGVWIDILK